MWKCLTKAADPNKHKLPQLDWISTKLISFCYNNHLVYLVVKHPCQLMIVPTTLSTDDVSLLNVRSPYALLAWTYPPLLGRKIRLAFSWIRLLFSERSINPPSNRLSWNATHSLPCERNDETDCAEIDAVGLPPCWFQPSKSLRTASWAAPKNHSSSCKTLECQQVLLQYKNLEQVDTSFGARSSSITSNH